MVTRRVVFVLAGVAALGLWWAWPDEARRVQRHLERLAEAASPPGAESEFDRLARMATLASGLTPDVTLHADEVTLAGRDRLLAAAASLARSRPGLTITLDDLHIVVADDGSRADVQGVARSDDDAREVRASLVKRDGQWLLGTVDVVPVLGRPGTTSAH